MNPWIIPVGVACALFLAGVAVSLFVLYRSRVLVNEAGRRAAAGRGELDQRLEAIATQVQELREDPPLALPPAEMVKPGFNLSKRSQALRMHRRGDQPHDIAAALDVPCQEIELLLKVHRIVLNSIG